MVGGEKMKKQNWGKKIVFWVVAAIVANWKKIFPCIVIMAMSSGAFAWNSTSINKFFDVTATGTIDAVATVDVSGINNPLVAVHYDNTLAGDANNTVEVTFYGMTARDGYSYKIGAKPVLTGVYDTDGAISLGNVDANVAYEIPGSQKYIMINWDATVVASAACTASMYVVGKEF